VDRGLALAVARAKTTSVMGSFERHVSPKVRTLTGSAAGGRWGPPGAYPVLYFGRPTDSVIVEAYRHLVEDVDGMRPDAVGPRRVLTVDVQATQILDLRDPASQLEVGLSMEILLGPHEPCQAVGLAAHQLGLHGVIAPAATGLGETLALFERTLPAEEIPVLTGERMWETLPRDPRIPYLLERDSGTEGTTA
jgi:RES domain-containing protein